MLPILLAAGAAAAAPGPAPAPDDPAALVNPFVGTQDGGQDFGHGGGAGMTFPGAALPFGMMQWSPDTVQLGGGGYRYDDLRLRGFSMTHISGPGCASAQDFPVIPIAGTIGASPATRRESYVLTFTHAHEEASPGYYRVDLDSGVRVELAAAARAGVARFSFPSGKPGTLLLDVSGSVNGVDRAFARVRGNTVSGWATSGGFCGTRGRYTVYFHAAFDRPFQVHGTWAQDQVAPAAGEAVVQGPGGGVYLQFDGGTSVQMRAGLSYVSVEGARRNLEAEIGGRDLDAVHGEARQAWNARLGQVAVEGGGDAERRTFYTALYHALLQPYVFDDVDGRYAGFDGKPRQVRPGRHHYATFSGWDIYRSEVQLLALLAPDVASDIAQSMYDNARAIGDVWDRWSHQNSITGVMNGDPYHSILASIYAFGARDFDAKGALASMVKAARRTGADPATGYDERPGNADYLERGFLPGDPSTTLEYAVADFGIAQLARRLGDAAVHREFMRRAQAWQNLYNPANAWLQPRSADGSFVTPFDPADAGWYVEGNGAQYHWMVPHNLRALFRLMGGREAALRRLDAFFTEVNAGSHLPYAYLGNEPSLQTPWLYVWAGAPHKTQELVRRAQRLLFKPTPDGLVGNDDLGTLSAWYVWASLGLYPVIPGRAELVLNSPLFPRAVVRRSSGQALTIEAPGASDATPYVQSLSVDGRPATRAWLPESFAAKGGALRLQMGARPQPAFGAGPEDEPPSFGEGQKTLLSGTAPGSATLEPGASQPGVLRVQSLAAASTLTWTARAPEGVTVTPSSGTLRVPAEGAAEARFEVGLASTAPLGLYSVRFALGAPAAADGAGFQINAARRGTLAWYANNPGITDDAQPTLGNFDGGGWSYSVQGLAAAGIAPGGSVRWKQFTFTWPDRKSGELDNINAVGQVVELPDPPLGATRLGLLGAAANGDGRITLTVTYADGTTQQAPVAFSDWCLGVDAYPPRFGNEIVATSPYRNGANGGSERKNTYVFAATPVSLDPARQVKSLTLSKPEGSGDVHVFAWAFAR